VKIYTALDRTRLRHNRRAVLRFVSWNADGKVQGIVERFEENRADGVLAFYNRSYSLLDFILAHNVTCTEWAKWRDKKTFYVFVVTASQLLTCFQFIVDIFCTNVVVNDLTTPGLFRGGVASRHVPRAPRPKKLRATPVIAATESLTSFCRLGDELLSQRELT